MPVRNPNPAVITDQVWACWDEVDAADPDLELGGVYADKPGYHNARAALWPSDYSVAEVADDRAGPAWAAAAIDGTPRGPNAKLAMRIYTSRLDVAARTRDERLFIDGHPVIREFIGTLNNATVYCYVLTGGLARGLNRDAGPDYGRDESHLWHWHVSIIRRFLSHPRAMAGLASVLRGEPIEQWRARMSPDPEEEIMIVENTPIPTGYAYDAAGNLVAPTSVAVAGYPPAGHKDAAGPWKTRHLHLSLTADHVDPARPVKVRVAINNGGGYTVKTVDVKSGPRVSVEVPAAAGLQAYSVTVGRVAHAGTEPGDDTIPLTLVAEIV